MNWDQLEGQWHQVKGNLKSKWGKLTDDDVTNVAGKRKRSSEGCRSGTAS